jgi:hypothetical protein
LDRVRQLGIFNAKDSRLDQIRFFEEDHRCGLKLATLIPVIRFSLVNITTHLIARIGIPILDQARDEELAKLAAVCGRVKTDLWNYNRIVECIGNGITIENIPIPEFD